MAHQALRISPTMERALAWPDDLGFSTQRNLVQCSKGAGSLRLCRARWNHVIACVISPAIGLRRRWFGYFLIRAQTVGDRT